MTIKEAIHTLLHSEGEKDAGKAKEARSMGIDALIEISKKYPLCESCGNELNEFEITFARHDGKKETGTFRIRDDWNGKRFSLVVNNMMIKNAGNPVSVRCPHCKKAPFRDMKVNLYPCTIVGCTLP